VEGSTEHERRESVPMFQAAQLASIMRESTVRSSLDRTPILRAGFAVMDSFGSGRNCGSPGEDELHGEASHRPIFRLVW
jgi:hypothetical protein